MLRVLSITIALFFVGGVYAEATKAGDYYVSANRLSVRLAPSTSGSITNTLNRKQKVEVFEVKNGWARVSKYYNGSVEGKSGQVARWVSAKYLSTTRPTDNFTSNTKLEKAIKNSDNYSLYRNNFIKLSDKLIKQGKCNLADYTEMGGWVRSTTHKPKPIYFTYCGGFSKSNKVYINAKTGRILN
ncbi:SH3 domain-containing protein [Shewanella sp. KX20019]|uniref:SH3 domain-containing protein n=1 Tax=Shewanella sp. KX20019 TaxID=2803864 RepID=UPI001925E8EF|nr:SH3 domain-containing protein [Shewanella sp. KX20019]QQX81104.1 SH3 domain-containing protein [Shewanella sp. KX20019]